MTNGIIINLVLPCGTETIRSNVYLNKDVKFLSGGDYDISDCEIKSYIEWVGYEGVYVPNHV